MIFKEPQHFHEFFEHFSFSLCTKIFQTKGWKLRQKAMLKKKSFYFEEKPQFLKKFETQMKFCSIKKACKTYEWYLREHWHPRQYNIFHFSPAYYPHIWPNKLIPMTFHENLDRNLICRIRPRLTFAKHLLFGGSTFSYGNSWPHFYPHISPT